MPVTLPPDDATRISTAAAEAAHVAATNAYLKDTIMKLGAMDAPEDALHK